MHLLVISSLSRVSVSWMSKTGALKGSCVSVDNGMTGTKFLVILLVVTNSLASFNSNFGVRPWTRLRQDRNIDKKESWTRLRRSLGHLSTSEDYSMHRWIKKDLQPPPWLRIKRDQHMSNMSNQKEASFRRSRRGSKNNWLRISFLPRDDIVNV